MRWCKKGNHYISYNKYFMEYSRKSKNRDNYKRHKKMRTSGKKVFWTNGQKNKKNRKYHIQGWWIILKSLVSLKMKPCPWLKENSRTNWASFQGQKIFFNEFYLMSLHQGVYLICDLTISPMKKKEKNEILP